jgi:hypothetical protein
MPLIELELSQEVYEMWRSFLGTTPAGRLREVGKLGDWVALGFMTNVERFLKEGGPGRPAQDREQIKQQEDASARKRLTKAQKRVLPMFNENECLTLGEIARVLGLAPADAEAQVRAWLGESFLAAGPARQGEPTYTPSKEWQLRNLAANRPSLNTPRVPLLMKPIRLDTDD